MNTHKWVQCLIDNLDSAVDEDTRVKVLENCGRKCTPRTLIKKAEAAQKYSKDKNEFLDRLSKVWKHLQREGDDVYVVYEKCYCPLVRGITSSLSSTWCNCSRGWIKELFESALHEPVDAELQKSIIKGDDVCRFRIRF
jgi:predicted hydrocarbon binding protein